MSYTIQVEHMEIHYTAKLHKIEAINHQYSIHIDREDLEGKKNVATFGRAVLEKNLYRFKRKGRNICTIQNCLKEKALNSTNNIKLNTICLLPIELGLCEIGELWL